MRRIIFGVALMGITELISCSNEKTSINNESGNSGNATQNDSSTTNPINSEYGTPNASENPVDSAQSATQDSTAQ